MTIVADITTGQPSSRQLMDQALAPHILLGMPHLAPAGLSETWLMKELGHRHWLLLARDFGMADADFRTPSGEEAYAAICATSLESDGLATLRANDVLTVRSSLVPVGRARFESHHRLFAGTRCIARVSLVSAFVSRTGEGNSSIARTMIAARSKILEAADSPLMHMASELKSGRSDVFPGLDLIHAAPVASLVFTPSISQEFNGAGLLYFAEFQAMADRAIEQWSGRSSAGPVIRRHVVFLGNLEPGSSVSVELLAPARDHPTTAIRLSGPDGRAMAVIVTSRQS